MSRGEDKVDVVLLDDGLKDISLPPWRHECYSLGDIPQFWDDYRDWLKTRGVTLYDLRSAQELSPLKLWYPPRVSVASDLPFACPLANDEAGPLGRILQPRFGYGQDESGRDVIIKVIDKGGVEHDINQYLLANQCLRERSAFPNVLSPVAVLDSPYDFSFLVMPLWCLAFQARHALETVGDVMLFMKCLLTGLAFLHDNRIAHRDINTSNMLVNCYNAGGEDFDIVQLIRDYTRTSSKLAYCLFDFNLSRRFPLSTDLRTARLPRHFGGLQCIIRPTTGTVNRISIRSHSMWLA
ncbi:hypothetical protein C8Q79DRAFT_698995 [Trametes meyenii]|nr:hypothetical protein C8Q79DRAFT_698995 [Trametes meyenii]